jgi:hypothetical protein
MEGVGMKENKLDRLRLLIDSLVLQAQGETDERRKEKLVESVRRLRKRYMEEWGKVNHASYENIV